MSALRRIGTLCTAIALLLGSVSIAGQPIDLTQLTVTEAAKLIKKAESQANS